MWNLFTVGSLKFPNDSTIASLEANQNRRRSGVFIVNFEHISLTFTCSKPAIETLGKVFLVFLLLTLNK